jgi:histidinol-phosphatase (PHP family)
MFDCHVHSSFSGDSKMDPLDACNTAIKLGLDGLTFTDHLDFDYPDFNDFSIDFDTYSLFMDNIKAKYKSSLKVFKGIEIGIQPHVIEESSKIAKQYDFDYIIGSVHIIDKLDPSNPKHNVYISNPQHIVYESYLKEILYMIHNFDNFDALGHIDYIRRYDNCNDVKLLRYSDYKDIIDLILKELILKGKGMEVNSGGFRYRLTPPLLDIDILKRYRELGGEIICTGSDAHCTANIGDNFSIVKGLIANSGFKYIAHFEARYPVFEKI